MKKLWLCLFLILAPPSLWSGASAPAYAQEVPLSVEGNGVKLIKVPQVIEVDREAVLSFPVTIKAPKGAGLYFWNYPQSVTATDQGDSLLITAAAKGLVTVSVKAISAKLSPDGKFLGFETKFGSRTLLIGADPGPGPLPPTPPVPPVPVPPSALVTTLKDAFTKDGGDKAKLAKLAAVTKDVAKMAGDPLQSKTVGDVSSYWKVKVVAALGNLDLVNVRKAQADWLKGQLPGDTKAELTPALRQQTVGAFGTLAAALEEVAK